MDAPDYSVDVTLRDGAVLHIRGIRPDDKENLAAFFNRLSPETRYFRFLGAKTCLTDDELAYLTELDFVRRAALVAELAEEGSPLLVGVARYATAPGEDEARPEVALAVDDAHQGRGIGTLLLTHLSKHAASQGITEFDAYLLADNERMLNVFKRCGFEMSGVVEGGVLRLILTLPGETQE
jgi:RimJ/RimL family protein N-acetyltransferase